MKAKVLVADDDADNRAIVQAALESSGFEVLLAADGLEALDLAAREKPDLILLDMAMPRMSGWEASRRLRRLPNGGEVPILAFTAHALAGDELKAREAGCDDYLPKPCLPRDLVERVGAWLERRQGATP